MLNALGRLIAVERDHGLYLVAVRHSRLFSVWKGFRSLRGEVLRCGFYHRTCFTKSVFGKCFSECSPWCTSISPVQSRNPLSLAGRPRDSILLSLQGRRALPAANPAARARHSQATSRFAAR